MATKNATKPKRVGPGRLSAAQAAELPDRLLDAALKAFAEHGFADTTMDQIARAAGASTKTIYARYSNKVDILRAVIARMVNRTIEGHQLAAPLDANDSDPREFLVSLCVQTCMRIATEAAPLNRLAISEGHRLPELLRLHAMATEIGAGHIHDGLKLWHGKGLLTDLEVADLKPAADLCLSMATDWIRINTSLGGAPNRAEVEQRVGFAIDMFLRGCGYRPEAAARHRKRG